MKHFPLKSVTTPPSLTMVPRKELKTLAKEPIPIIGMMQTPVESTGDLKMLISLLLEAASNRSLIETCLEPLAYQSPKR